LSLAGDAILVVSPDDQVAVLVDGPVRQKKNTARLRCHFPVSSCSKALMLKVCVFVFVFFFVRLAADDAAGVFESDLRPKKFYFKGLSLLFIICGRTAEHTSSDRNFYN
jgi:hypothetical protein